MNFTYKTNQSTEFNQLFDNIINMIMKSSFSSTTSKSFTCFSLRKFLVGSHQILQCTNPKIQILKFWNVKRQFVLRKPVDESIQIQLYFTLVSCTNLGTMEVSSAKKAISPLISIYLGKSFIWTKKRDGPRSIHQARLC